MKLAPDPAPAGAMCAAHPEVAADSVCSRCGNFMCSTCSDRRSGMLCPACREALGTFPLKRDDYDFSRMWNLVFETWRRDLVLLGVCGLIFSGISAIGQVVFQFFSVPGQMLLASGKKENLIAGIVVMLLTFTLGFAAIFVAQGVGMMGLIRVVMDSLHAKKVQIPRMFSQLKKIGRYLAIQLVIGFGLAIPTALIFGLAFALAVLVGGGSFSGNGIEHAFRNPAAIIILILAFVGFFVAAVYITIPLGLAQFELVYSGCSAIEAIRRAWVLGNGHRMTIFGYTFVAGLVGFALILVGFMALCVGVIIAAPLAYAFIFMMQSAVFLTLRNGSGMPAPEEQ